MENIKKKKKGSIIALKAIVAADNVGVLQHQNKELYSQVRLLKRKLQKQKMKTKEQTEQSRVAQLLQSLVLRNWNALQHDLYSLLQIQMDNMEENDLDPPKKKPKISESVSAKVEGLVPLLLKSGKEFLESDVTQLKRRNDDDDESEDEEKEKEVEFEAIEENMKNRISFTDKLFSALLEKNKQLAELPVVDVDYRTKARKYQMNAEAYNHRIRLLEQKLKALENELEDTNTECEVAIRRLNGWKSLGADKNIEVPKQAAEVKSESMDQGDKIQNIVKQEGAESVDEAKRITDLLEDMNAEKKLAEDRLKELEEAKEKGATMAEKNEKLEQELSRQKALLEGMPAKSDESLASIKALEREKESLKQQKEHMEMEAVLMREQIAAYREAIDKLESPESGKGFEAIRKNKELNKELSDKKLELERVKRKLKHAEKSIQIQSEKKTFAYKKENQSKKKITDLEKLLAELKEKLEQATKEKKEADESRNKVLEENLTEEQLKVEFQVKGEKIKELEKQVVALTEELSEMEEAVSKHEHKRRKDIHSAEKKLKELEGYCQSMNKKTGPLEDKVNQLKMQVDALNKEILEAKGALEPKEKEIAGLKQQVQSLLNVVEKGKLAYAEAKRIAGSAKEQAEISEADKEQARADLIKERQNKQKIESRNIMLVGEIQKQEYEIKRLKEESSKSKRLMKRAKSQLDAVTSGKAVVGGDVEMKLEMYENALHCPINKHLWKNTILMRCYHMHSRKAIMDNYNKRNRKCPTCKLPYTKDDIKPIFLIGDEDTDE